MPISQSNIKKMLEYNSGACGKVVEAQIRGTFPFVGSIYMDLGNYFEYLLTGQVPRDGKIPEPVLAKTGATKGEPLKVYKTAEMQAARGKKMLEDMGVEIIATGEVIEKLDYKGIIDIRANYQGREVIIDVKYAGQMGDRWAPMGWQWSPVQVDHHAIQARHYHIITGLPFYYFVCAQEEGGDIKFFEVEFSEPGLDVQYNLINDYRNFEELIYLVGLEARPEFNRCKGCQLKNECEFKSEVTEPIKVQL